MSSMTPPLHIKGRFTTKSPWELPPTVIYECIAIRTFEDVYKQGIDVYDTYYKPMGLITGSQFNFAEQVDKGANIITLKGSDNSIVYIPDTYILSFPQEGLVRYQHVVIGTSLGALPDFLDLSALKLEIENLVSATVGSDTTAYITSVPSVDQPTQEQHEILEAGRVGSITRYENHYTRLKKEEAKNLILQEKINTLITVLKANNLIPN